MNRTKFTLAFISLSLITACATSPTGRSQLLMMPDSQMNSMGAQSFSQMKQETPIDHDPRRNEYVKCIAMAIAHEASEMTPVKEWEVVVFNDNQVNAFALPGGKIGVYTGILPVANTAGQLAAVLGHEVGHVIARHGNERVSEGFAANGILAATDALTIDSPNHGLLMGALGVGTQVGVMLPFSRSHESEADVIGLDLMSRAGFDPHEAVTLWQHMASAGGSKPPQILSTHPSDENREKNLESRMGGAMETFQRARASGKNPQCRL